MDYCLHILVLVSIYAILAISLNLIVGHTGLVSLCHAACCGIGAYAAAILAVKTGAPFVVSAAVGIIAGGLLGTLCALPSLRVSGDYLVMATYCIQVVASQTFLNCDNLTGGARGIYAIPRIQLADEMGNYRAAFLAVTLGMTCIVTLMAIRMVKSPLGRVLHAIREDEAFAQSLGKNVAGYKLLIFSIGGSLAGLAGCLFAFYISYIDPSSFTVMESIFIISMVIIGGAGSTWGPLVGAVILVTLPEALRFVGLPSAVAANLRQIIYGSLLVIVMMFRSRGLVGKYGFSK